jgi:dethiobiotin synthetase
MTLGFFITATGTGCGKTFVTRGLARALTRQGCSVSALKPVETGVIDCDPADALALARACGRPDLAYAPGLLRAAPPLAPYAISLEQGLSTPSPASLAKRILQIHGPSHLLLVEGAGGLLVPLDADNTFAELATALALPLLVVAPNRLGVLSHVLTLAESAAKRRLPIAALILSHHIDFISDSSQNTNPRILRERLSLPVLEFPLCGDDDAQLADAADACGLTALANALAQDSNCV